MRMLKKQKKNYYLLCSNELPSPTQKATNEVVQYWLDKQSLYAPGSMKVAYGTFSHLYW
jgi:hypothetical protein